jgi:hypothetical protein
MPSYGPVLTPLQELSEEAARALDKQLQQMRLHEFMSGDDEESRNMDARVSAAIRLVRNDENSYTVGYLRSEMSIALISLVFQIHQRHLYTIRHHLKECKGLQLCMQPGVQMNTWFYQFSVNFEPCGEDSTQVIIATTRRTQKGDEEHWYSTPKAAPQGIHGIRVQMIDGDLTSHMGVALGLFTSQMIVDHVKVWEKPIQGGDTWLVVGM